MRHASALFASASWQIPYENSTPSRTTGESASCAFRPSWTPKELFAQDDQALRVRILKLERRIQLLLSITRLLLLLVRLFGFRLDSQRVPSGKAKSTILGAFERAKKGVSVTVAQPTPHV